MWWWLLMIPFYEPQKGSRCCFVAGLTRQPGDRTDCHGGFSFLQKVRSDEATGIRLTRDWLIPRHLGRKSNEVSFVLWNFGPLFPSLCICAIQRSRSGVVDRRIPHGRPLVEWSDRVVQWQSSPCSNHDHALCRYQRFHFAVVDSPSPSAIGLFVLAPPRMASLCLVCLGIRRRTGNWRTVGLATPCVSIAVVAARNFDDYSIYYIQSYTVGGYYLGDCRCRLLVDLLPTTHESTTSCRALRWSLFKQQWWKRSKRIVARQGLLSPKDTSRVYEMDWKGWRLLCGCTIRHFHQASVVATAQTYYWTTALRRRTLDIWIRYSRSGAKTWRFEQGRANAH